MVLSSMAGKGICSIGNFKLTHYPAAHSLKYGKPMKFRRFALFFLMAVSLAGAKKKDRDDTKTQRLPDIKEPPAFAIGDAAHFVFHLSPMSPKGLLSQQTREGVTALLKLTGGNNVVHLRAFVAGSGDLRRVPQIVAEVFTRHHQPIPSLSIAQVGALPMEGAQVVFESVSETRKPVNPAGITFVAAQDSVEHLAAKTGSAPPLTVTCLVNDIAKAPELTAALTAKFPGAVLNVMQSQRLAARPFTSCEAVVRGGRTGQYVFTGTQSAFGFEEKDATLAFQRIGRELTGAGASPGDVVLTNVYALTRPIAEMALKARPAGGEYSVLPVEGIAASDGSFAIDVVAIRP